MKISLVTTTVTVPRVLEQYRALDKDVTIIVAGDDIDPETERAIDAFCAGIDARYLSYAEQASLDYAVHDVIGPLSIQRRNVAILEAIRSGADIVVTVDDDNEPAERGYFAHIRAALRDSIVGPCVRYGNSGWFNPGAFSLPPYSYRGFPYSLRPQLPDAPLPSVTFSARRIGVLNGLVEGDPDINATERIEIGPLVHGYDVPFQDIAVHPSVAWAPINSQNTAYVRELTPLMAVLPGVGRYDDIFGSFIAQRVLMDTDWHVAFGQPFVRQERHPHDLLRDLEQEMFGMRYTERFVDDLKVMDLWGESTILGKLERVYHGIARLDYMPGIVAEFGYAWLNDVEKVL